MNRQQLDKQIEYLRRELTNITQELYYLEGPKAQALRIRQSRLSAELERVQDKRFDVPYTIMVYPISANGLSL